MKAFGGKDIPTYLHCIKTMMLYILYTATDGRSFISLS